MNENLLLAGRIKGQKRPPKGDMGPTWRSSTKVIRRGETNGTRFPGKNGKTEREMVAGVHWAAALNATARQLKLKAKAFPRGKNKGKISETGSEVNRSPREVLIPVWGQETSRKRDGVVVLSLGRSPLGEEKRREKDKCELRRSYTRSNV